MKLNSMFSAAIALAITGCALFGPANAQAPDPAFDSFMTRLADNDVTLTLESQLAELLAKNDRPGLRKLAATIKQQDAANLDSLQQAAQAKNERAKQLALRMNPCHYAGLALRTMAMHLGEGRAKAKQELGVFWVRPGHLDELFAENVRRCELVKRLTKSERKIGLACVAEGRACPK